MWYSVTPPQLNHNNRKTLYMHEANILTTSIRFTYCGIGNVVGVTGHSVVDSDGHTGLGDEDIWI